MNSSMKNDHEENAQTQPSLLERLKSTRKVLRWVLMPMLLWFAYQHVDKIYQELLQVELQFDYVVFLVLFVFVIFCSQAGVSKSIVDASESHISFMKAIQLNIAAGFWGLVMPFGSVGYKAQVLKLDYQISVKRYASLFVFSTLLSAWLSIIFLCATVLQLDSWPYRPYFIVAGGLALLLIPVFYILKNRHSKMVNFPVVSLGIWHMMGLFSYIGLYYFCFKTLGLDLSLFSLSAWVAVQSLLFVFPLVPGNLVIMEALGAYLLVRENLSAESIVIGIALMRLSCLLGLLALSPWVVMKGSTQKANA